MARDPLLVLRAVRQRAVEQARQGLAACLKVENEVAAKIDEFSEAMRRDRSAGEDMPDAHQFHQLFANRLDAIRAEHAAAVQTLAVAQARVAEARAVVVTERTQTEAVEQLISEQNAARLVEEENKTQHEMDDIARAARSLRRAGRI
jgi:flagellar biosynthesis chaperone FliJ